MVTTGGNTVEATIEHMCEHRQRMPIRCHDVSESPFGPRPSHAPEHFGIPVNVGAVIEIYEAERDCLPENDPDQRRQPKANPDDFPKRRCALTHRLNR